MLWHFFTSEPEPFSTDVVLAVAVLGVELLYFERETLEREVASLEATVLDDASAVPPDVE